MRSQVRTTILTGASNYWQVLIELRPYMFQCATAIYQVQPKSALFKLLALQNPDVRNWMFKVFPDLKRLKDSEKEPLDLARIQNEALRLSLEEVRVQIVQQTRILERMEQKLERRTAVFSPAKGYSNEAYSIGAANLVWPPIFGQKSVAWPKIFPLIHDPQSLFSEAWSVGGAAEDPILGHKSPLRLVEQYFKAKWRSTAKSRKFWERFREIPEWIDTEMSINSKSPEPSIGELEALRSHLAKWSAVGDEIILIPLGMNTPVKHLTQQRKVTAGSYEDY
ncbi:hypothetical protein C8J57DRAFT_1234366 [Mycena rebaudengoi]|nr:hypothetical protein C8J57DRAFT_1234366 [Mycena rebaudengoi]